MAPTSPEPHVPIDHGLAQADVPAELHTIAVNDAGTIPYYSGWTTIDFIGLNDEPIAHGADVTNRVTTTRPIVIVVRSYDPNIPADAYGLNVSAS